MPNPNRDAQIPRRVVEACFSPRSISNTARHIKKTPEKTFFRSTFREGSFISLFATEVTENTES